MRFSVAECGDRRTAFQLWVDNAPYGIEAETVADEIEGAGLPRPCHVLVKTGCGRSYSFAICDFETQADLDAVRRSRISWTNGKYANIRRATQQHT